MKTFARGTTMALAIAAFAMACADSATGPQRSLLPDGAAKAITQNLIDFAGGGSYPTGLADGVVRLCKTANEGGTFNFTVTSAGGGTIVAAPQIVIGAGGGTECLTVYTSDLTGNETPDEVEITEGALPSADWALTNIDVVQHLGLGIFNSGGYTGFLGDTESEAGMVANVFVNGDMARTVTFTNTFTPPEVDICTFTKGWYRNNGSSTVIAVDGRSIAEAQAIFNATPGKPGTVDFGGDATLLNLYQQLLAALNNLGGDANADDGPDAVDDAIADALAGTDGSGTTITTTLTQDEMSDLIDTLSAFNEGTFLGFPHCDDN